VGSAEDVYRGMDSAVTLLKTHITDAETDLQKRLRSIEAVVAANQKTHFCLPRPRGLLGETDADDFYDPRWDRYRNGQLKIDPGRCRMVGHRTMPELARTFAIAADQTDGAGGEHIWMKDPSLGLGATGPYAAFDTLRATICSYLNKTATALVDAGEHLALAAGHIQETDTKVAAALLRHVHRMQHRGIDWQPFPAAGAHSQPPAISYPQRTWAPWQEMMIA